MQPAGAQATFRCSAAEQRIGRNCGRTVELTARAVNLI